MNITNEAVSDKSEAVSRAEQGGKGVLKLGLDMHYRQVTVAMQAESGPIKSVGRMSHDRFGSWVDKKLREGWEIHSCYEAGASGYWMHRDLVKVGVKNLVAAPKAMGRDKRQKTDRRDSAELADSLDRYLRSKDKRALCPVAVPTVQQEQDRALVRFHRQLMADRNRYEARGKGLLCAQGIEVSGKWWSADSWKELKTHPRFKSWMAVQLRTWRSKLLGLERHQGLVRKQIEAMAPQELPKGLGAYSAVALECEMKGITHFESARAVSSYTGLCPGIHSSNGQGKEGSINRCGNASVRWNLVETVWRMLKWQPDYEPVRQLRHDLVRSKRARKRLVVKAARQLAVDLWRLESGKVTAQELHLVMHQPAPQAKKSAPKNGH